mgnify:CR=1 FL=1
MNKTFWPIFWQNLIFNRVSSESTNTKQGVNSLGKSTISNKVIESQFDCFCKKVLKNKARDCFIHEKRHREHEIPFSSLTMQELESLYTEDVYSLDTHTFQVLGFEIQVRDWLLGEAISMLTEQRQIITLLAYSLGFSDKQIGEIANLVRSTVQYQRKSSLKQIKKYLEEHSRE